MSGCSIFRVYESYHELDESGTYEYGYYSSFELALARAESVWKERGYPEWEKKNEHGIYAHNGWDHVNIEISKIIVDKDTDNDNCGYT